MSQLIRRASRLWRTPWASRSATRCWTKREIGRRSRRAPLGGLDAEERASGRSTMSTEPVTVVREASAPFRAINATTTTRRPEQPAVPSARRSLVVAFLGLLEIRRPRRIAQAWSPRRALAPQLEGRRSADGPTVRRCLSSHVVTTVMRRCRPPSRADREQRQTPRRGVIRWKGGLIVREACSIIVMGMLAAPRRAREA